MMQNNTLPGPIPQPVSLTKRAFAQRHSISLRTTDYWIDAGLPVLRVSRRKILIPVADGDQWVRDRFLVARTRRPLGSRSTAN
jgi:hypothetical protein